MNELDELNLLNQLIELGAKAAHAHAQSNSDDGHKGTAAYVQWHELRAEMGELIRKAYAPQADSQPAPADVEDAIAWLVTWKGGEHTYAHAHASELPAVNQARMMGGTVTPCVAARAPADSVLREALPTIKGTSITGGYVVVTPAGWGDNKAAILRDAILRTFPVNPAFSPNPGDAAPATKGGA